jgi:hypothetical protein
MYIPDPALDLAGSPIGLDRRGQRSEGRIHEPATRLDPNAASRGLLPPIQSREIHRLCMNSGTHRDRLLRYDLTKIHRETK